MAAEPEVPRSPAPRRLIVNADDFGLNTATNQAVIRAHREGILTTASLMVNEPGFAEAVEIAREHPRLGVGLHLTLLCGHSSLPPHQIPGLVNASREFLSNPVFTGFRFFFRGSLRSQLRSEIHAQFKKFQATGLKLDHVNGHLHLHVHPTIFSILTEDAAVLGIKRMRLPRDPFRLNLRLAAGRLVYRISHAVMLGLLSKRAKPVLDRLGIRYTRQVFGLLQNALVDAPYVRGLLSSLPPGDSELYSHPSVDDFQNELNALIDPHVRELINRLGIQLIRYQDL
jgi:hopanoid biosynthesis associated protein HpnK